MSHAVWRIFQLWEKEKHNSDDASCQTIEELMVKQMTNREIGELRTCNLMHGALIFIFV